MPDVGQTPLQIDEAEARDDRYICAEGEHFSQMEVVKVAQRSPC
ncbi:hypothetical protein [Nostoc sp. WHI]|nr:hypothetical protein [Nostoc sp. WHI]